MLVCENCIVYCADRIRCFPGKRRSQEVPHFTGEHGADSVQTLVTLTVRLREVKTFGLILYLVQSIKQALLSLTPLVGILNRKQISLRKRKKQKIGKKTLIQYGHWGKVFLRTIRGCKDRRQHTQWSLSLLRGDYHPFDNLRVFSPPDWIQETDYKTRLRRGRGETMWEKDGWGGGFRAKSGLGSEVGNLDVFLGK